MARDTVGLLDALELRSAHIVGASMGGAIGQAMAIEHPERMPTFTSMMSTTGDPSVGQGTQEALAVLLAPRPMAARSASGDRTPGLRSVRVPTLVLHGTDDPLATPSGGVATAEAIPGSELVSFEGMGHDLPRELWPAIVDQISALVARGEALGRASD